MSSLVDAVRLCDVSVLSLGLGLRLSVVVWLSLPSVESRVESVKSRGEC